MTDASQSEKVDVERRAEAQRIAERFLIYGDNQAMNLAKQFLALQAELEAAREREKGLLAVVEAAQKMWHGARIASDNYDNPAGQDGEDLYESGREKLFNALASLEPRDDTGEEG